MDTTFGGSKGEADTGGHTFAPFVHAMRRVEDAQALDVPVAELASLTDRLLRSPRLDDALRGAWLGHALHPLLTDFPLGAWASASLLDLFGGRRARPAATGLVAFGLVMVLPTAAAGVAEWRASDHVSRRVGLVHAGVNGLVTLCYTGSLLARVRGRHTGGVALGIAGGTGAWVSGYIGGHLSLVRKVGTAGRDLARRTGEEHERR